MKEANSDPLCLGPAVLGYGAPGDLPVKIPAKGAGYPVCSSRWGNGNMTWDAQLDIFDFASLAFASYYDSEKDIRASLGTTFRGTQLNQWELLEVEPAETIGRWIVVDFPQQKVRVVAVRGTATKKDMYADLQVYSSVAVFQIMSMMTPVLKTLGSDQVRRLVQFSERSGIAMATPFWEGFVEAVGKHRTEAMAREYTLLLTGHSLGGALVGLASAFYHVHGIAFSAPGLYYQTGSLGFDDEALLRFFTNVKPRHDIVPRVDQQTGSVNSISCQEMPAVCHRLAKTTCELWSKCGDPRGRDFRQSCSQWYKRSDLGL